MPSWYEPRLDVLRFVAFGCVFTSHGLDVSTFAPDFVRARLGALASFGLVLFFVLSAFLLARLLRIENADHGHIDVRRYFRRRILRIWPLYFAVVAAAALAVVLLRAVPTIAAAVGVAPGNVLRFAELPSFVLFVANWYLAATSSVSNFLPHLWSLSVEEQFYVVLPALFLASHRRPGLLPAIAVVGTVGSAMLVLAGASDRLVGTATTTYAMCFAAGMWLADRELAARGRLTTAATRRALLVAGATGFAVHFLTLEALSRVLGRWAVFCVVGVESVLATMVIAALAANPDKILSAPSALLAWLGKRGYGLYVFHWPILQLAVQVRPLAPQGRITAAGLFVTLAATVAVSTFSYRFLELPFLQWRQRLRVA